MKTPAIIASLTVAGSIAFAAGQQSGSRQPQGIPSRAQAHAMQEEMPQARMAQIGGGCNQGADKNWFTTGHPLPSCATLTGLDLNMRPDINGDGTAEILLTNMGMYGYAIVRDGSPSTDGLVMVHECSIADGNYSESISSVLRTQVGEYFKSQVPSAIDADASFVLRDMDGDGDLDLVVYAYAWSVGAELKFWLENTGYQHTTHPPLAADLNGDGQVNGADLGLLLVAWGPNP